MIREIGSEFHKIPLERGQGIVYPRPGSLVFSGRTAIEMVLKELPEARSALLPSFCCESMIIPFRTAGIEVKFYTVEWDSGMKFSIEDTADILVWCNYFGYRNKMPDFDGVIIEDITHSFMSEIQYHRQSDYLVASIRKWEPIYCGGYCSIETDLDSPSDGFINLKARAMELKDIYLKEPDTEKKDTFLAMFNESNHWLAENYSTISIDAWSRDYLSHVDVEVQRQIRRQNAQILYDGLGNKVQFLFRYDDMDCPLFVPILLENRDKIRRGLISRDIYCPVHWPKPKGCESNLYDMELSLICDQRYGKEDMERIVCTISEIL